ncbi:PepSY-like domain-containing protein [Gelidibacter salicanalis]|uniref:PepSY-like domain-containing protein n=1 Tax=Gelidibacter salicanalis TaxID=291193 RepID=A0A934KRL7_9FLAO|nr:PepSY-like domain-containing protein [Gelidibacter salicanalis]MBJ7882544.1 PepSY-like domain-containing protein [Gelidibacter salicanalis]
MKTLKIILGTFLTCAIFAFSSGGDQAPQKVKDAFAKKFPTAKNVKWDKENATEWEAEFKMNKTEYSANFLEDGTWKETEHEIDEREIPQNVKSSLMTEYSGYKIKESELSETKDGMLYEFEIKKGERMMEISVDSTGNIVKKEVIKENGEGDKD